VYHLTGEGESPIPVDYEDMTNTIFLLELLILGGIGAALFLLVHVVRQRA
jgi:hypothetical protein